MEGLFITLEGPEGAGKSTQIELLNSYLTKKGYQVVQTREPGGTTVGDRIREILLDNNLNNLEPKTELLLYCASRAQHILEVIKPALLEGKIVLCDRFSDATLAYQGYGRKIDIELIQQINRLSTAGLKPDLTFILDIDSEEGLHRAKGLDKDGFELGIGDRIENEKLEFHKRVRSGYLDLAKMEDRFEVIDANHSVDDIFKVLVQKLEERLVENEDSK
ncbi:dTMP kinase [Selenihalanaerobacter shriftii]|uniref:Thymidylate kinase n=1 Tax=Selenihalanaerobacter shriftii TaxID=142842 RepID=A0A1T4N9V2_9FIRM|nr:dTMP kinase [Selenihalanaerobacter shriftii]SJZ75992.1 thymidylate kinase [Selenihalanaerobacter shriftii]